MEDKCHGKQFKQNVCCYLLLMIVDLTFNNCSCLSQLRVQWLRITVFSKFSIPKLLPYCSHLSVGLVDTPVSVIRPKMSVTFIISRNYRIGMASITTRDKPIETRSDIHLQWQFQQEVDWHKTGTLIWLIFCIVKMELSFTLFLSSLPQQPCNKCNVKK
jgi:hypothetical protein